MRVRARVPGGAGAEACGAVPAGDRADRHRPAAWLLVGLVGPGRPAALAHGADLDRAVGRRTRRLAGPGTGAAPRPRRRRPPRPGRSTRIATVPSGTWLLPSRMPGSAPPVGSCAPGPRGSVGTRSAGALPPGARSPGTRSAGPRPAGVRGSRAAAAPARPVRRSRRACPAPPQDTRRSRSPPKPVCREASACQADAGSGRSADRPAPRRGRPDRSRPPAWGRAGRLRGCRARCRRPRRCAAVRSSGRLGRRLALRRRRTARTGHPRGAVPVPDISGNGRVRVVPVAGPVVTGCRGWGAHHRGPVSASRLQVKGPHLPDQPRTPGPVPRVWTTFRSAVEVAKVFPEVA